MPLQWKAEFALGVAELDAQHLQLDALVRTLHDGLVEGRLPDLAELLPAVRRVVERHFPAEEAAMRGSGYPDALRHVAEHRAFLEELAGFDAALRQDGPSQGLCVALGQFLADWIRVHQAFDTGLRPWLPVGPPRPGGG